MKKVVYTTVIGKLYKLYEPTKKNKNWDYVCFTDQNISSKGWNIRKIEKEGIDDNIVSRKVKILNHLFLNEYDVSLYIDSKFTVKCDLDDFYEKNMPEGKDISLMKHHKRDNVYEEAQFCIDNKIGDKDKIEMQIKKYKKEGFPDTLGLLAPGIMIRKHHIKKIESFMEKWYEQVVNYSGRDQLSFPYLLWKNPLELNLMPFRKTYDTFR